MISHLFIGVTDFDRAFQFYSAIMHELGHVLKFKEAEKPWAGWIAPNMPRPLLLIGHPYDDSLATAGNGQMIALLATSREVVDRTYAKALSLGATCEGVPGLRTHYHPDYYGAYFRDCDGNKICVCCHAPDPN